MMTKKLERGASKSSSIAGMNRQDRRNAVVVAVIAATATIVGALISSSLKKDPPAPRAAEPKIENKAETKGAQSPAVAGTDKDVTITYGEPTAKGKPAKPK